LYEPESGETRFVMNGFARRLVLTRHTSDLLAYQDTLSDYELSGKSLVTVTLANVESARVFQKAILFSDQAWRAVGYMCRFVRFHSWEGGKAGAVLRKLRGGEP